VSVTLVKTLLKEASTQINEGYFHQGTWVTCERGGVEEKSFSSKNSGLFLQRGSKTYKQ
jgi:hypothetical protein